MARQFSRLNTERLQPIVLRLSRRAVELDPDFAAAWALMSSAQCEMHQRGHSPDDGRTAAERAVALKPDLAEAHAARSDVLMRSGDFAAGLAAALEALKLDPDCFESHMSAGFSYAVARDHVRSIQHFELASALEPNACRPISMVVSQYEALGNRENTMAAGRRAIALAERVLAIEPDHGVALSAKLAGLTVLRDVERAREWARLARLLCPDNLRLHYNCACGLALLGDVEEVVAIMDGLIAEASLGYLRWMQTDSDFDSIRGDQRFVALMQRVSDRIASG
jgi:adenylate cyclase